MSKQFPYPHTPIIVGAMPHDNTGDNNLGIRTNDATQRYTLGTRAMSWDGRVYRYFNAGSATASYQRALYFNDTGDITYEAPAAGAVAGARELMIAEASITEDYFSGGYLLLFHATGDGAVYSIQGNTATSGSNFTLYTVEPFAKAVTTSDAVEIYVSPYADLRSGTTNSKSWGGIPAQGIMTSGYYGWLQTWGICFISPQAGMGEYTAYNEQTAFFRNDGSIDVRDTIGANVSDQRAGSVIIGGASGNGPLLLLQVNI